VDESRTTERFLRQHEELMMLGKALGKELDTRTIAADPSRVRRALAAFSGKLRVHAVMEEEALYPRLRSSNDAEVVKKALELESEVGTLYRSFFAFLETWSSQTAIQARAEDFCRDAMKQLFQLSSRMRRENRELYPLADACEDRERASARR
jgi:hypothetical protein